MDLLRQAHVELMVVVHSIPSSLVVSSLLAACNLALFRRVKLNLLICCPFGEYELDLDIQSYDDESTTRTSRLSFEVENGADEVRPARI